MSAEDSVKIGQVIIPDRITHIGDTVLLIPQEGFCHFYPKSIEVAFERLSGMGLKGPFKVVFAHTHMSGYIRKP